MSIDTKEYEINMDITNYDGFVTPMGFLKVRASDADDTYPTHSDYAREYLKIEWGMDFDNSYDALRFLTDELRFVQYSNRVYIWENDNEFNLWQLYQDALKDGRYNEATLHNLYFTCVVNSDFYKMVKSDKGYPKTKK